MNNFIKKARPAQKHPVVTSWEQTDTQKGLSKVEGILTSAIQFKHERESGISYCYAFFQLEGLEQDIPVIFKLDDSEDYTPENLARNKPDIPPQSKVLLEGKWAKPTNYSNRPSFTCWAYQILTPPSPPTIKSLREQISSLLTTSLEKQSEWKQRTDFLFRKRKDLEELDKLAKLPFEYLQAYLLIRQAHYANYQDNLLQHTTDLTNTETYLTKLSGEIEEIAQHIRAYQSDSFSEPPKSKPPKPSQDPWTILQKDYNPRQNCQHLVEPNLTCGKYGQCLLLKPQKGGQEKWICAKHAQNYEIVGDWSQTWQQDFKVNPNY